MPRVAAGAGAEFEPGRQLEPAAGPELGAALGAELGPEVVPEPGLESAVAAQVGHSAENTPAAARVEGPDGPRAVCTWQAAMRVPGRHEGPFEGLVEQVEGHAARQDEVSGESLEH